MVNQPTLSALCGDDGVKQMGTKKTKKMRGSRKRNIDVDPAQKKVTIATWNGHRGRGGRTSTPPESQEDPAQPPRRPSSLTSGTTPLTTTTTSTKTTTARVSQRERDGAGGAAGRNRYPTASGGAQAPPTGKMKPPLTLEELSEGMLTEEAIRVAAGKATTRQLRDVSRLQIVIDSSKVSVESVWDAVPKLHTLTLDGSRLESFRDLGVGLRHLNTLSLESSCVEDLDGIGALSGLRELRLARNRVSDVTPLACHGCLQVLGLERNRVSDMKALEILSSLPLLYSLNVSQNPLTESLSKLRDGRGRGVVRQLIPQIRVLDGIQLSGGESGAVDAQTLDEAVDLICRDASRARAAWSEEGVTEAAAAAAAAAVGTASTATTIKVVQEDRWRPDGVGKDERLPLAGLDSCFSRSSRSPTKPGVATVAGLGGGGSPIPPQLVPDQGGGMHWDSDLTQGGRQALSGNPSSAIRRHQCRGGAGNGRNEHTPTRVLETLDLAKVMEKGLKQRHSTQQSADRVSEWRRETNSDSFPQEEDPSYEPLDETAPPSPLALEALPLSSSSAVEGGFHRRAGLVEGGRRDSDILATKPTTTWASLTTSVANPPKSPAAAAAAAAVDDGVRQKLSAGKGGTRASSGRPWTSEGDIGASGRGGGSASVTNQWRAPPGQEQHGGAVGDDRGGSGGRRRGGDGEPEARPHRRRRRPQTAKEAPGKRCMNGGGGRFDSEQDETFRNYRNACWQPVWESLQTARLISSPRLFQTTNKSVAATNPAAAAGVERGGSGGGPATQAGDGMGRKIGSVDFGRQRRARATVRASRVGDDANYLDLDGSDGASSARDEGEGAGSSGGDDAQEADDRTEIKKRASGFCSPASKASGGSGIASRLSTARSRGVPTSSSSPSAVLPAEEEAAAASAGSTVARELKNEATPQQPGDKPVEGNSSGRQPPKARRREAASLVSRRSLQVMDDTSSSGGGSDNNSSEDDGDCCIRRAFKLAASGRKKSVRHTEDGRRGSCSGAGVSVGASAAVGSDGGGRDGGSSSSTGGFSPSPNRVTSIHASRMLGFDLQRSLAAIEEWTDKAPAAAIIGGGNHCANTPRQEAPYDLRKNRPAPFFVEHTAFPSPSPSARGTAPFSSPPVKSNLLAGRESEGGGGLSSTVISDSSMMPQTIDPRARAKATVVPDIIAITQTDDSDDGEAVLSVAAARAALGISKGVTAAALTCTTPRSARAWVAPTPAEIDALTAEGIDGRVGLVPSSSATQACASKRCEYGSSQAGSAGPSAGVAVGICDEDLKEMLKKQPRMVPELRTKEHFREFFQGMGAERMERLLRGAYEDLPPDQVDKKVKKRLGLVGDKLAW